MAKIKRARKYATGGKVTRKDVARSKMKPDDNSDEKIFTSKSSSRLSGEKSILPKYNSGGIIPAGTMPPPPVGFKVKDGEYVKNTFKPMNIFKGGPVFNQERRAIDYNGADPIYKKGTSSVKLKKMNRGTGYFKGTQDRRKTQSMKHDRLGIEKFNEKLSTVTSAASAIGGVGSSVMRGVKGVKAGSAAKNAGLKSKQSPNDIYSPPKVDLGGADDFNLDPGQVIAKKGLNMKKKRKYKTSKK